MRVLLGAWRRGRGSRASQSAGTQTLRTLACSSLLATLLAGAVDSRSAVATPLTLSIAENSVYSGPQAHFHVLWTNTSLQPVRIWADSNSWGYRSLWFEITDAAGKHWRALKKKTIVTQDAPAYVTIAPGQTLTKRVFFGDTTLWEGFPAEKDRPFSVHARAVFHVAPSPEAARSAVWTGRIESGEIAIIFGRT